MIVNTAELTPGSRFPALQNLQIYNGLDCCVTLEVWEAVREAHPGPQRIYDFNRALQAPYMEIMNRGMLVDGPARASALSLLRTRQTRLQGVLNSLAIGTWGKTLNPNSPSQLKEFFYTSAGLGLPEVWQSKKGERKLSTDREALEKLDDYMLARPFTNSILALRDIGKQISVLDSEIDPDGRFRTSYNIAGTETGRPSSSTSSFGTGGNAQNISPGLRHIFTADPGYKYCVIDLEQVEARDVGFICGCLFGDWSFLDSCESGDLHTNNAKLIWPELPWTGDKAADRILADQPFYRDFSYRDMAKRGSHLSNYSGTAWTMARSLKIPQALATDFQNRYCRGDRAAFPAIARWWQWTATQLQSTGVLRNLFGMERQFFGRLWDDTTLREAIAFQPQSTTAFRMNLGMWKVWKELPEAKLLGQTYDSITFQALDNSDFPAIVDSALSLIRIPITSPSGREYIVPGEAKIGWNWGNYDSKQPGKNPDGLKKYIPGVPDTRSRACAAAPIPILQRRAGAGFALARFS